MRHVFMAGLLRGLGQVIPFLLLLLAAHRIYPPVDLSRTATRDELAVLQSEVRNLKAAPRPPGARR